MRAEAPAPALRLLAQWAQAAQAPARPTKTKRGISWLLMKMDWLLYEKLKLLPDTHTGRRLNFFPALCILAYVKFYPVGC